MANRHSNKKIRSLVLERMEATGEGYQRALAAILREGRPRRRSLGFDLIVAHYFGVPITLAVYEAALPAGRPLIVHVPSSKTWRSTDATPAPPLMGFRGDYLQ